MTRLRAHLRTALLSWASCGVAALLPTVAWPQELSPAVVVEELAAATSAVGPFAFGSTEPDAERAEQLSEELEAEPENARLLAELMRVLVHLANLGELSEEERKATYQRGTEIAERAMALVHGAEEPGRQTLRWKFRDELVAQAGQVEWGGVLHYWTAVIWGGWGDVHGAMPALREGVADRLRLHGHIALELVPEYDWAGPLRFLGRMHAVAPKVPMFTGWVDRKVGRQLLEQAYETAPEHPQNQLFVAESWLDQQPKTKRDDAEAMLMALVGSEPRPGHTTLDLRTIDEARAALERLESLGGSAEKPKTQTGDGV